MIGVCNLSNVPLRREPSHTSEIVSQLLFGEGFDISEQQNGWSRVTTHHDQYTGWIHSKQFEMQESPARHNRVSGIYPFAEANSDRGKIMIPPGSSLPDLDDRSFILNGTSYTLAAPNKTYDFSQVAEVAMQYEHVPYLWGGRTPFGIDCSGFTQAVFKQCGIQLRRDARQQAEQGETLSFREEAQCGDLAFFDNEEGRITHVGIMLDANRIIHASGFVRIDEIDHYGILNKADKQYSHKLRILKRIRS